MSETLKKALHQGIKMCIFCKKNQNSTTPPAATENKKLWQSTRKALRLRVNSRKYLWTKESLIGQFELAWRPVSKNKRSC
jgi:hypothetical protein